MFGNKPYGIVTGAQSGRSVSGRKRMVTAFVFEVGIEDAGVEAGFEGELGVEETDRGTACGDDKGNKKEVLDRHSIFF